MSQMSFTDLFPADITNESNKDVVTTSKSNESPLLVNYVTEFLKVFNGISRHHNRYDVFRDFVTAASISLENNILKSEQLEDEFKKIESKYSSEDMASFSKLLGILIMGLEAEMSDFLGKIFMNLEFGSVHLRSELKEKPYITVNEPTCGAGGMIIALAKHMLSKGYNPQNRMLAVCVDIDPVAARMCYIQLSLLGIPAIVSIGNTLTLEVWHEMHTPFYYLNRWKFEK